MTITQAWTNTFEGPSRRSLAAGDSSARAGGPEQHFPHQTRLKRQPTLHYPLNSCRSGWRSVRPQRKGTTLLWCWEAWLSALCVPVATSTAGDAISRLQARAAQWAGLIFQLRLKCDHFKRRQKLKCPRTTTKTKDFLYIFFHTSFQKNQYELVEAAHVQSRSEETNWLIEYEEEKHGPKKKLTVQMSFWYVSAFSGLQTMSLQQGCRSCSRKQSDQREGLKSLLCI